MTDLQKISKAYIKTQVADSRARYLDQSAELNELTGMRESEAMLSVGDANDEGFYLMILDQAWEKNLKASLRISEGPGESIFAEFKLPADSEWRLLPEDFIVDFDRHLKAAA